MRSALAALAVSALGVLHLAGCDTTSVATQASIDRPIPARLEKVTHDDSTAYKLIVPSAHIDYALGWTCAGKPELTGDDSGARIAVRCPGDAWRVIYVGTHGRAFTWPTPIGTRLPSWDDAPVDFDHAAADIYRASETTNRGAANPDDLSPLLAEVRQRHGPDGLATFLLAVSDTWAGHLDTCDPRFESAWRVAADSLPTAYRAGVARSMASAFATPLGANPSDASIQKLDKAIALTDLDDVTLGRGPRDRLAELLALPDLDTGGASVLMRWWSKRDPVDASALACAYATSHDIGERPLGQDAMLAIAHGRKTCPGLVKHELHDLCADTDLWQCDHEASDACMRRFKIAAEQEMASTTRVLRQHAECRDEGGQGWYLPAAVLASGAIEPELRKQIDRGNYRVAVVGADEGLPSCERAGLPVGTRCYCTWAPSRAACELPATTTAFDHASCHFAIEDKTHAIITTSTGVAAD